MICCMLLWSLLSGLWLIVQSTGTVCTGEDIQVDLGELYIKYHSTAGEQAALVPMIQTALERLKQQAGFSLIPSVDFIEKQFYGGRADGLVQWHKDLSGFFKVFLMRNRHIEAPKNPEFLFALEEGEIPQINIPVLDPMEFAALLYNPTAKTKGYWVAMSRRLDPFNQYIRAIQAGGDLSNPIFKKNMEILDPLTFCLIARLVQLDDYRLIVSILRKTSSAVPNPAWYYYLVLIRAPTILTNHLIKKRTIELGKEGQSKLVLALAHVNGDLHLYRYFRASASEVIKEYRRSGELINPDGASPRDILEAAIMNGLSDDQCLQFIELPMFSHDLELLLVAKMKGRSSRFIDRILETPRFSPYHPGAFTLPMPSNHMVTFKAEFTRDQADHIMAHGKQPGLLARYLILGSAESSWRDVLFVACMNDYLEEEDIITIISELPSACLPEFIVKVLPYCTRMKIDIRLSANDPAMAELTRLIDGDLEQKPLRNLIEIQGALSRVEYKEAMLLALYKHRLDLALQKR